MEDLPPNQSKKGKFLTRATWGPQCQPAPSWLWTWLLYQLDTRNTIELKDHFMWPTSLIVKLLSRQLLEDYNSAKEPGRCGAQQHNRDCEQCWRAVSTAQQEDHNWAKECAVPISNLTIQRWTCQLWEWRVNESREQLTRLRRQRKRHKRTRTTIAILFIPVSFNLCVLVYPGHFAIGRRWVGMH